MEEFESPEFKPEDEELGVFRIQLYQKHLPCLVEGGYITWGRDTDTITRGPDFEEMRTLIELITNHQNELSENWP